MAPLIPQSQGQSQPNLTVPDPSTMQTMTTSASNSHPATPSEAAQAHTALLQELDLNSTPRPFRNPSWKPPQRRNKTVKQILADQARREALALAASANSVTAAAAAAAAAAANAGNTTRTGTGDENSAEGGGGGGGGTEEKEKVKAGAVDPSTKAATYKMSTLAIERRAAAAVAAARASNMNNNNSNGEGMLADGIVQGKNAASGSSGPIPTYTNIESAPSLHPASRRHYCDVTGLPAPYRDPKTRLRYHNGEVFGLVRTLGTQAAEAYLEARGAHTVLK